MTHTPTNDPDYERLSRCPVEPDTRILLQTFHTVAGIPFALQLWTWDGITASSAIFLSRDVEQWSDERLTIFVSGAVHADLGVDVTITREFQENKSPWLSTSMILVSAFGNFPLLVSAVVLITALIFWYFRLRLEALFIVGLSGVSLLLNVLIKLIVSRPRPSPSLVEIIQMSGGQSFPSGHVMSYVAFWGLLLSFGIILFKKKDGWWRYMLLIISALFVVLVGPSRIYLGDHWASDVLGGYLFGGLLLGVGLWIYLRLKSNGLLR